MAGYYNGADITSGQTYTASSDVGAFHQPFIAFDDNEENFWQSDLVPPPMWIKIDFGEGDERTVKKLRVYQVSAISVEEFTFDGSNNDSDWDTLLSVTGASGGSWEEWGVSNTTTYRYYRIYATDIPRGFWGIREIEMMTVYCFDSGVRYRKGENIYSIAGEYLDEQELRFRKGDTTVGLPLVATDNDDASPIRIYDGSATKALVKVPT